MQANKRINTVAAHGVERNASAVAHVLNEDCHRVLCQLLPVAASFCGVQRTSVRQRFTEISGLRVANGKKIVIRRRKPPLELWTLKEHVYRFGETRAIAVEGELQHLMPLLHRRGSTVTAASLLKLGLISSPVIA